MSRKKLALSLSGGGAKSMIYLGVIKALQENDIPIDFIGGLSGGSIISALFGLGMDVSQIFEVFSRVEGKKLLDLNPLDGVSILDQAKVYPFMQELFSGKNVEDCRPPVLIFATDFDTNQQIAIDHGNLASAVMGSCALFPLLSPVKFEGRRLIEGGFTTHYGANFFHELGADIVIGADVSGFANVKLGGIPEIIYRSFNSTVEKLAEYEQQLYPVDVDIKDFADDTGMFEFNKMGHKLVTAGRDTTQKFIPEIKRKLAYL